MAGYQLEEIAPEYPPGESKRLRAEIQEDTKLKQQEEEGKKFDVGKLRYDLVPWEAFEEVVDVLTRGAAKYAPGNWCKVTDWKARYYAAAFRHLVAYWKGEFSDSEWGTSHLSHAICCLLFLLAKEKESREAERGK